MRRISGRFGVAGMTTMMAMVAFSVSAPAQTYRVLHSFTGGTTDGENPDTTLVHDSAGNFYGTTGGGGAYGGGTVFKVDRTGKETVLHSFAGGPVGGLLPDADDNLYGTTGYDGAYGWGTVFEMDTTGKETVLYNFTGYTDGGIPDSTLVRDGAGNLYGTTYQGGDLSCGSNGYGCGTVFELDTTGNETVLHSFTGKPDGEFPTGALVRDTTGNLYGTTFQGVANSCLESNGCGMVYKVDKAGTETAVYSFAGGYDGSYPFGGLLQDASSGLYGTTYYGGDGGTSCGGLGCGTVFKLDTSGQETVLYSFTGGTDGSQPAAGLVSDAAGNLYGTTYNGGTFGAGTVFELATSGAETVLHSFTGQTGGANPAATLARDGAGNLYGTTVNGGTITFGGVVFRLKP
jgi:uncharacterized repeat protein (TIGR03803 family)